MSRGVCYERLFTKLDGRDWGIYARGGRLSLSSINPSQSFLNSPQHQPTMFHRLSLVVLAFFMFFAALVRADGYPDCAMPCVTGANPGSCSATDNACMCSSAPFCNTMNLCFKNSCSHADWVTAYNYSNSLCSSAGVTKQVVLNPPTKRAAAPEPMNTGFVPVYIRSRNRNRK